MWIRTQDKHFLVNACAFEISDDDVFDGVNYLIIGLSNNTSYLLGKYSTEEKALKVLDDIQTHLKFERRFISNTGSGDYWLDKGATVYQMLQDEDVEV